MSKKTTVIYVTGDDDFGALQAEQEGWTPESIHKKLVDEGVEDMEIMPGIYAELHEFGEVDKDFIMFIRQSICDYDQSKHSEFYIIE